MSDARHEVAWAWASGLIEFGSAEPRGSLPIARGPARRLRAAVSVCARHSYDGRSLVVPGVPEAASPTAAVDALIAFQMQVLRRLHPARGRAA